MRVEPAPHVFRNEDRRQRPQDRRGTGQERRADAEQDVPRARHASPRVLFASAFGAHILGQVAPQRASARYARRAYQQPEARTPLRPSHVARA